MPVQKYALIKKKMAYQDSLVVSKSQELSIKDSIIGIISGDHKGIDKAGVSFPKENATVDASTPPETKEATPKSPPKASPPAKKASMLMFFFQAFLFGLAGLVTPCVFPMIPMTVSFFTKTSKTHTEAVNKGLFYGFSIIFIYTVIGTLVAIFFGADAANFISTHWLPNMFFFVVFIVFAASFLGLFEITLPNWLVNKADKQSDKGGWIGIFFMASTIVLVSFSCTGPLVGTILIESAGGKFLKPIVGMLGFSSGFAIPFTLFALFPSWLKALPKSGGWLNTVKVFLGFLELALSFKFLSQADQVYHWRVLDREVFLAIWIVIFTLLGLYLIRKIKLSHDDVDYTEQPVGVPRLFIAICSFAFVIYLIPGMFGAPLKILSGYLPPLSTSDFVLNPSSSQLSSNSNTSLCDTPKYEDLFHFPHGLKGYFDLKQAQACAKQQHKPLFIDFTGHGCANCREMEANVWSDPEVLKRLREDFVIVSLYVDERKELPKEEWYTSSYDNKEKATIGKQNADLEIRLFNNNAQPLYVVTDAELTTWLEPRGFDRDVSAFVSFLEEGKKKYGRK
jgi:thiol:disulfide interchange protein DsbD